MSNKKCGECDRYWEIKRATMGGGFKDTGRGHCLAQSVYASNAPGKPTYPPKGTLAETPDRTSKVVVVRSGDFYPECISFQEKKTRKAK